MEHTTESFENPYNLFAIGDRVSNGKYKIYSISHKTLEAEPCSFFNTSFKSYEEAKRNFEEMRNWTNNMGCKRYKNAELIDYDMLLDLSCTLQLKAGLMQPGIRLHKPRIAKIER